MTLDDKQRIARENGSKSKGPITPEGKHRSSLNGITHGLASKCVVLANESEEAYDALLASYQDEWKPASATEQHLVIQMTNAYWRLRRIWSMETALFDAEMFCHQKDFDAAWSHHHPAMRVTDALSAIHASNAATLETLHKYEMRYDRIHKSSANQILKLRRHSKRPIPAALCGLALPDLPDPQEPQVDQSSLTEAAPLPPLQPPSKLFPLWLTRLFAVILSLLSATSSAKHESTSRNRPRRTSEPTTVRQLPVFNFHLPEIFAWFSHFTPTPPRRESTATPEMAEKPHESA